MPEGDLGYTLHGRVARLTLGENHHGGRRRRSRDRGRAERLGRGESARGTGWRVVVLESAATPGGAVRSTELIEPGYVNDVCSAFYPLGAASPILSSLDLERDGLRWLHAPTVVAHPALDGTCAVLSRDLDVTAASFDEGHPGDGDAWRAMYDRWTRVQDALLAALFTPFPPLRATARIARSLSPTRIHGVRALLAAAGAPARRGTLRRRTRAPLGRRERAPRGSPSRGAAERLLRLAAVLARARRGVPGARGWCERG